MQVDLKEMWKPKNLKEFIERPHCDLGDNGWRLAELASTFENARFLDLGVRLGPSSALMSIAADEKNNKVVGCVYIKYGVAFMDDGRVSSIGVITIDPSTIKCPEN